MTVTVRYCVSSGPRLFLWKLVKVVTSLVWSFVRLSRSRGGAPMDLAEILLWGLVFCTLMRARYLLNQERALRAIVEVPFFYFLAIYLSELFLNQNEDTASGPRRSAFMS